MSSPAAIVFDLDGTLVDSRPDLVTAINRMRGELDLAPLGPDAVGRMVGEGSRLLVQRALGGDADPGRLQRAHDRFLAIYSTVCTVATRPYPGISELLERLARRRRLALLTNKPEAMTRTIVERFGWDALLGVLLGGDSLPFRKPDPRTLLRVAEALALPAERLLMVGDSRIDAETARAADVPFLWVEWGYAADEDRAMLAAGPSVATPVELAGWLERAAVPARGGRLPAGGPASRR